MSRVLILSLIFSPDNVSTAHIISGIAEDLQKYGHDVRVITTAPHYNRDPELEARQPLKSCFWGLVKKSHYKGIPIYHVLMPNKKCAAPLRCLSWAIFHCLSTLISAVIRFKADVVIAPSPPLSIGLNAYAIARIIRAPYIYNVQELYPDIAINLGVIKNKFLIHLLAGMEKFIYNQAGAVTTITQSIYQKVVSRIRDASKVHLIPNYVDFSHVESRNRINDFSVQYHIENNFVVTYAGNMGIPQNLWILVEAAKLLKNEHDISILFIGDGSEKAKLNKVVERDQLVNVRVIDYQPYDRMPSIYAASDLFYVGQSLEAHSDGIPSKIYRIMANNKPILAVTQPDSDLALSLNAAGAGTVISSNDPAELAKVILDLKSRPEHLRCQGMKAHEFVAKSFERSLVSRQYDQLIRSL